MGTSDLSHTLDLTQRWRSVCVRSSVLTQLNPVLVFADMSGTWGHFRDLFEGSGAAKGHFGIRNNLGIFWFGMPEQQGTLDLSQSESSGVLCFAQKNSDYFLGFWATS